MKTEIYTIGHSNHTQSDFVQLIKRHYINVVADVRSHPYSQHVPQFNRGTLEKILLQKGTRYVFLGKELGALPANADCYEDGKVQYDRITKADSFQQGLNRLRNGVEKFKIALMCTEKDPINCHRMILICRNLKTENLHILHILEDGKLEANEHAESRLLNETRLPRNDLFVSHEELVQMAYDIQGQKIAFSLPSKTETTSLEKFV